MKYQIKKEQGEWIVFMKKTGCIIAYFDTKYKAEEYMQAQIMDDERSQVMSAYNMEQLKKELLAEFF